MTGTENRGNKTTIVLARKCTICSLQLQTAPTHISLLNSSLATKRTVFRQYNESAIHQRLISKRLQGSKDINIQCNWENFIRNNLFWLHNVSNSNKYNVLFESSTTRPAMGIKSTNSVKCLVWGWNNPPPGFPCFLRGKFNPLLQEDCIFPGHKYQFSAWGCLRII